MYLGLNQSNVPTKEKAFSSWQQKRKTKSVRGKQQKRSSPLLRWMEPHGKAWEKLPGIDSELWSTARKKLRLSVLQLQKVNSVNSLRKPGSNHFLNLQMREFYWPLLIFQCLWSRLNQVQGSEDTKYKGLFHACVPNNNDIFISYIIFSCVPQFTQISPSD